jgi:hypothetical protein
MTEAAEDRCWNCGVVPKRWIDVTSPGLDERRLLCSNCFARTTLPFIFYGWLGRRRRIGTIMTRTRSLL